MFQNNERKRESVYEYIAAEKKADLSFARRENDPNPFHQACRDCACNEESRIQITRQSPLDARLAGIMKAMLKSELAAAAGVSGETFRRWLLTDRTYLLSLGVKPAAKLLPPKAVNYLIDKYCIDLPHKHT